MRPSSALISIVLLAGCSQPRTTVAGAPKVLHFTRAQILQNRKALELTAAYRARAGIATATVRPSVPHGMNMLQRAILVRDHPELGYARPVIQGVDDIAIRTSSPAKKEIR